ncbi:MAG: endonuclease VII domain-containing protein [Hyphomonadaceae bacterium]|nr:endonuclease VII domain-containing protein [Hyphomonadaceae bacterium]
MSGLRECAMCKEHKLPDFFSKKSAKCKPCAVEVSRKWVSENGDRYKEWQRAYRSTEIAKSRRNGHRIKYRYGLSLEQMNEMLEAQEHKCAICRVAFPAAPHIDHCHVTGVVRGLLCDLCNRGLGYFKDKKETLLSAAKYLSRGQQ